MKKKDFSVPSVEVTRRDLITSSGLVALGMAFGIEFSALAESSEALVMKDKEGLKVLNDKPVNAETPPHLLDDEVTPLGKLFVRNNGLVPDLAYGDAAGWTLTIDGEVRKPLVLTLDDLKKFKQYTYHLVLECAGNGRAGFYPPATGNQWTYGGVGCPLWTGVRLKDVLAKAGVKPSAVYIGYYGHDVHLSQDPEKIVISRGVPIAKALDEYTLIALEMNGKPLPPTHGFPARLVCPGYPASTSGKWLKRITVRDKVHDGVKMTGHAYRLPKNPVKPGTTVPESDMVIIEGMPVKSLVSFPQSGTAAKRAFECRGFAWAGKKPVAAVHVSYDFGQTWVKTKLSAPRNAFGWQRWQAKFNFPTTGYYELWVRATDATGRMQPMVVPGWNPEGYLNNAMARIAVNVA